jgi:carbamoyl-phosphate synthase small subunit
LDELAGCGLDVHVVGPNASFLEIEAIRPDGLFVSNGAGCPKQLAGSTRVLQLIRELSARLPTFGICLGHQLIALAYGGDTQKLSFGHHAVNHPVRSEVPLAGMPQGFVMMTSQNHNYHVVEESIAGQFVVTHRHMNDSTVAGIMHRSHPVFSVQFHPECNPGPHDARALFAVFLQLLEEKSHAGQN